MTRSEDASRSAQIRLWSGAGAGAIAAVAFAAIHQLLISNIWDMAVIMAVAGALSGLSLAWTYGRFIARPSVGSWVRYNLTYLGLFALIPPISVLMFDPVITVFEASESDGPLTDLLVEAAPLTVVSMLGIAAIVTLLFGSLRRDFGPTLVTSIVLMLFLGLNLTIMGLVDFSSGDLGVVAGFMALIVFIVAVFVAAFTALEWRRLSSPFQGERASDSDVGG
jgi:hypothetical protein